MRAASDQSKHDGGVEQERLTTPPERCFPEAFDLIPLTASEGFPYISSRAEAQIAGTAVLRVLAERQGRPGRGGDRRLRRSRAWRRARALRHADRWHDGGVDADGLLPWRAVRVWFTFTPSLGPWYSEQVRVARLDLRFAGVHAPDDGFADIKTVAGDLKARLTEVCRTAARAAEDGLILAGAPIAGLAGEIRGDVEAVLLDPVQAGVLDAVTCTGSRPTARIWAPSPDLLRSSRPACRTRCLDGSPATASSPGRVKSVGEDAAVAIRKQAIPVCDPKRGARPRPSPRSSRRMRRACRERGSDRNSRRRSACCA